jgi:hypothetical protein
MADIPEAAVCAELGITMIFNVGGGKVQSSSLIVDKAIEKRMRRQRTSKK